MRKERGITLVEVLVTLVILAIGLLGLVGLQARVQILQIESYQRAQALMLLNDMTGRITNNRNNASTYVTGPLAPLGAGITCPSDTSTRRNADVSEWCEALQGASETQGSSKVGAMIGGRGCVEDLTNGAYLVTVAWQGLAPISASAPPAGVACAKFKAGSPTEFEYAGGTGSSCVGDLCRRAVTTVVQIATLAPPVPPAP
jgi:type IV pilus assembly protein PilV